LVCVSRGDAAALAATLRSAVEEIGEALALPVLVVAGTGHALAGAELPVPVKVFSSENPEESRAEAIVASTGEWVVVLSDDLVLAPGWGAAMGLEIGTDFANVLASRLVVGETSYDPGQPLDFMTASSTAVLVSRSLFAPGAEPVPRQAAAAVVRHQPVSSVDVAGGDWRDVSDGVTVVLSGGGLGNQLVEFAAGLEQARRLDCPLYVDAMAFSSSHNAANARRYNYERRPCHLFDYDLPAIDVTGATPWSGERLPGFPYGNGMPAWVDPKTNFVFHTGPDLAEIDSSVRPGTVMLGFYQHPGFFRHVLGEMTDMIEALALAEDERAFVDQVRDDPMTTAHLRRGDYLTTTISDKIGVASGIYARRAIAHLRRIDPEQRFRVYSDSPAMVAEELRGVDGHFLAPKHDHLRPSALLTAMTQSKHFVASNSTLSWWAALIVGRRDEDAVVIAPRPWHRRPNAIGAQLTMPEWITVGNE